MKMLFKARLSQLATNLRFVSFFIAILDDRNDPLKLLHFICPYVDFRVFLECDYVRSPTSSDRALKTTLDKSN